MLRAFLLVFLVLVLWLWAMLTSSAHAEVLHEPDDPMVCGTWTYYAHGVMEYVRDDVRGLTPCEDCAGMAATVDQRMIGQRIEVWHDGAWRGVFQVVDVGNGHNRAELVGEVDYETAVLWDKAGPWWGCYRAA